MICNSSFSGNIDWCFSTTWWSSSVNGGVGSGKQPGPGPIIIMGGLLHGNLIGPVNVPWGPAPLPRPNPLPLPLPPLTGKGDLQGSNPSWMSPMYSHPSPIKLFLGGDSPSSPDIMGVKSKVKHTSKSQLVKTLYRSWSRAHFGCFLSWTPKKVAWVRHHPNRRLYQNFVLLLQCYIHLLLCDVYTLILGLG